MALTSIIVPQEGLAVEKPLLTLLQSNWVCQCRLHTWVCPSLRDIRINYASDAQLHTPSHSISVEGQTDVDICPRKLTRLTRLSQSHCFVYKSQQGHSIGATLSKGLNRGLGTLLATSLAFLTEHIADVPGRIFRAVFIAIAVFIIGTMTSYVRFIPYIKKNYDYGVLIFLLTFNLITVSSYRIDDGKTSTTTSYQGLKALANYIQVCVGEYFNDSEESTCQDDSSEDPIYKGYKAILDSKATDETLFMCELLCGKQALQASWEPRYIFTESHGINMQKLEPHFAISVTLLLHYMDVCNLKFRLGEEVSKVLRELANNIRNNHQFSPEMLSNNLNATLQDLNSALKSQPQMGRFNTRGLLPPPPHFHYPPAVFAEAEEPVGELVAMGHPYGVCTNQGHHFLHGDPFFGEEGDHSGHNHVRVRHQFVGNSGEDIGARDDIGAFELEDVLDLQDDVEAVPKEGEVDGVVVLGLVVGIGGGGRTSFAIYIIKRMLISSISVYPSTDMKCEGVWSCASVS
ncbi:hypothetical protein V8G54_015154 [Vigna mungo]|uniref:Uncharacterized protein n=1 Tax=Vigna mungo TaxID=3915 RepID=A0AAQ3S055_VIGMU